jgi:hypothetical protein
MTKNIGVMMAGGNSADGRRPEDFYATPEFATRSVLTAYKEHLVGLTKFAEPCCGDGAISNVIVDMFHPEVMFSSDLNPRMPDATAMNILDLELLGVEAVITNPPFYIAEDIIRHVLTKWQPLCLILLLKSTFFHANERVALFDDHRPSRVYPLPWRLDFTNKNSPTMECSWFIWDARTLPADGFPSYRIAPNMNPKKKKKVITNV